MVESGKASTRQEGGSHYKDMAIQPVAYIHQNQLGFCEGAVIKYVSRWRKKNGIADLKKAMHFLELLIEMEEDKRGKPEWIAGYAGRPKTDGQNGE